jgi:hypothetical protein
VSYSLSGGDIWLSSLRLFVTFSALNICFTASSVGARQNGGGQIGPALGQIPGVGKFQW